MALPKLTHPTYEVLNPATDSKVKCRPMLVKEEKILLMAKQADTNEDRLNATKQIVQNCVLDKNFKVDELPFFALEYLFIKIRAQSVSNKTKVSYQDNEDDSVRNFEIDLDKVEIKKEENLAKTILFDNEISMTLRYPTVALYTSPEFFAIKEEEVFDYVLLNSVDKIFEGDKAHDAKTTSKAELKEFIDSIPSKQYEKVREFFDKIPSLYYLIEYKNDLGKEKKIELTTLNDFFMLV